jgi:hypothetical protein
MTPLNHGVRYSPKADSRSWHGVHGANENTEIRGLLLMTKMFVALACDVLKARLD